MVERYKDLTIIELGEGKKLVIACDSTGGIGTKINDTLKVEPEIVGYYSAQVVLTELIAFGANPMTLINTLSVEMDGYGDRIVEGIKRAAESVGMDMERCLNGSTEENIPTTATGIGLTGIGIIENYHKKRSKAESGDMVVMLGKPSVGEEVINGHERDLMDAEKLLKIKKTINIKDIIPIGSKGAKYEIEESSTLNDYEYSLEFEDDILNKSAGPATSILVILNEEEYEKLKREFDLFSMKIGYII